MQQISGGNLEGFPENFLLISSFFGLVIIDDQPTLFFVKDETLLGDPERERIFVLGSTSWNSRKRQGIAAAIRSVFFTLLLLCAT